MLPSRMPRMDSGGESEMQSTDSFLPVTVSEGGEYRSPINNSTDAEVEDDFSRILKWVHDIGSSDGTKADGRIHAILYAILHGQVRDRVTNGRYSVQLYEKVQKLEAALKNGGGLYSSNLGSCSMGMKRFKRRDSWAQEHNRQLLCGVSSEALPLQPRTGSPRSGQSPLRKTTKLGTSGSSGRQTNSPNRSPGPAADCGPKGVSFRAVLPVTQDKVEPPKDAQASLNLPSGRNPDEVAKKTAKTTSLQDMNFHQIVEQMLSGLPEEEENETPAVEPPVDPRRLYLMCRKLLRGTLAACGVSAFSSAKGAAPRSCFKFYHWLVLSLMLFQAFASVVAFVRCRFAPFTPDVAWLADGFACASSSGLASDMAITFGAAMSLWYLGGFRCYAEQTAALQQADEILQALAEERGFGSRWHNESGRDAAIGMLIWLLLATARVLQTVFSDEWTFSVINSTVAFILSITILTAACFHQMATWRALSLKINSFIDPFMRSEVDCQLIKTRWRVMGACMRAASRTYQMSCVVIGATTALGSMSFLYDLQEGLMLWSLPGFLVSLLLPLCLLPAAFTGVACSRFPSLICMLDPGPELEEEFQDLAVFLSLTDCGCFLWDTKVTVGLLQKLLYMTVGFVGTMAVRSGLLPL